MKHDVMTQGNGVGAAAVRIWNGPVNPPAMQSGRDCGGISILAARPSHALRALVRTMGYSVSLHDVAVLMTPDAPPLRRAAIVLADGRALDAGDQQEEWTSLASLARDALLPGGSLIVATPLDSLDLCDAMMPPAAILLCEPTDAEVMAALRAARPRTVMEPLLRDSADDAAPDRLDRLSDELERLNTIIGRWMQDGGLRAEADAWVSAPRRSYSAMPDARTRQAVSAKQVRSAIRARRLREQILPDELFADPAWDILLDLMRARLEGEKVSVSSLCIASAVPPTTALRWIKHLTDRGLLRRQADHADGRRIFISLSDEGVTAVESWFASARSSLIDAAG